jgi:integrase
LSDRRVDEITFDDVASVVAALTAAKYKRETIRKTKTALSQILDFYAVDPSPARDERVKLPKEPKAHIPPPLAEHVERVAERMPVEYVLTLLLIDECGPRVRELETAQVGDLDEHRKAIRLRWTFEKNERYRHLGLPDDLYEALVAALPPREDRDLEAPLCRDLTDAGCGWRLPGRAGRPGRRTSRRTDYDAGAGPCTTKAPARSPRSPSGSATRSGSPPTTTSTR